MLSHTIRPSTLLKPCVMFDGTNITSPTFMGASTPYNVFTGASEMLAGVLLFFPTTTLLGALLAMAVMTQVVALNFCYDVPVKLFSTHLLAESISSPRPMPGVSRTCSC